MITAHFPALREYPLDALHDVQRLWRNLSSSSLANYFERQGNLDAARSVRSGWPTEVALTVSDAQGTCSTRVRKIVADGEARDTARRVDIGRKRSRWWSGIRYGSWRPEMRRRGRLFPKSKNGPRIFSKGRSISSGDRI